MSTHGLIQLFVPLSRQGKLLGLNFHLIQGLKAMKNASLSFSFAVVVDFSKIGFYGGINGDRPRRMVRAW